MSASDVSEWVGLDKRRSGDRGSKFLAALSRFDRRTNLTPHRILSPLKGDRAHKTNPNRAATTSTPKTHPHQQHHTEGTELYTDLAQNWLLPRGQRRASSL